MRRTLRRASTRFSEIREGSKGNDVVCKACYDELGGLVVLNRETMRECIVLLSNDDVLLL